MKVAVASGKGGTGKTTVATNLAWVASHKGRTVTYLDCDVEEPNGALFLNPELSETRAVNTKVPAVDQSRCTGCGRCGEICEYSAIVLMKGTVLTFPELCHGCAGCWLVCPQGAITEAHRQTGQLDIGAADAIHFVQGLLNIGEVMSPPVIKAVKGAAPPSELVLIDAPPGTSCPVIESVRDADFVVLVTEPTPFGLNDLQLAVEMVRAMNLPFGVVINRADSGDEATAQWCREQDIAVLAEIPDDRQVAEAYSRGEMACQVSDGFRQTFEQLLDVVENRAGAKLSGRADPVS